MHLDLELLSSRFRDKIDISEDPKIWIRLLRNKVIIILLPLALCRISPKKSMQVKLLYYKLFRAIWRKEIKMVLTISRKRKNLIRLRRENQLAPPLMLHRRQKIKI